MTRPSPVFKAAGLGLLMIILSACVSSTPPLADVPQPQAPAPVPLATDPDAEVLTPEIEQVIGNYWNERNDAFASGGESGLNFVVAKNHPRLVYTVAQCRDTWWAGQIPAEFTETSHLVPSSIEVDPEWTMTAGPIATPLTESDLGDGVFRMLVHFTYTGKDPVTAGPRVVREGQQVVHLQINGSDVRHFHTCERPGIKYE